MDMSDYIDDREMDELMISNYRKLDCRKHQGTDTITINQLTSGLSSKNEILKQNVLPLLKNSNVLCLELNPNLSDKETLLIARKMHNTLCQKGMVVMYNNQQHFIIEQSLISEIKKQIPASREGYLVN